MLSLLMVTAGLAAADIEVTARGAPLPGATVADAVLATMRGGLRLPNGLDLMLGIDIQTRIDGVLALHTVYASEGAQPAIRVYTDGGTPSAAAPATMSVSSGGALGVPLLVVDRSPTGTTIVPTGAMPATTVNLVNGNPAGWAGAAGQAEIPVVANGPTVAAAPGEVGLTVGDAGAVVTLRTPTLEVQHLIGAATGAVIANTANNRAIDTISAVNVDVQGIAPALLAGSFAAQRAALDAAIFR